MSGASASLPRHVSRETGLLGVLEDRVRAAPEEPALFFPEGLDVRWRSWRGLVEQAVGGAEALSAAGVGAGRRVGYRWRCDPDGVAADLAVQGAGGIAVPVAEGAAAADAGCSAWLRLPGEEGADAPRDLPAVVLPEATPPWARRATTARFPATGADGVRVVARGGTAGKPPEERVLSGAEVVEAARELGARLESAAGEADLAAGARRRPGREIAVAHLDLREPTGRAFLAWGLLAGAALYLEPDLRAVPGATAWARPTLVASDAAPLVELARQLRRREEGRLQKLLRRGRPPYPFGRLRLLVVLGGGRLPVGDVPFWAERGVVVLRG